MCAHALQIFLALVEFYILQKAIWNKILKIYFDKLVLWYNEPFETCIFGPVNNCYACENALELVIMYFNALSMLEIRKQLLVVLCLPKYVITVWLRGGCAFT